MFNELMKASMIRVECKKCGQKIKAPAEYAGKRIRCPKCKEAFVLESAEMLSLLEIENNPAAVLQQVPVQEELKLQKVVPSDFRLLNPNINSDIVPTKELETNIKPSTVFEESKKRKLPAVIDVFLYPASVSGMINIVVFTVLSLLMGVSRLFLMGIMGFMVRFTIVAYLYFYLVECIRDSATGGVRAPNNIDAMPDSIDEAKSKALEVIASFIIFWGPVFGYMLYKIFTTPRGFPSDPFDNTFWCLLGYGIIFFPMGILAIAIFDSSSGFNPFIWITSIFSTFLQYFILLVILGFFCLLIYLITTRLGIISTPIRLYLLMIMAHILGRFYYLNSERLNWCA
ncbi:MAG: hypothetical protein A2Y12_16000 [Planctomycetes bacterium GWF2_42_9]|nr:MAG: hypothetical protein A2Y12_16000 [Planctomycetes bacterium GWF2_42_9]